MPWQESTVIDQRRDFVALATQEGANIRELCRRFGISPTTGYQLLARVAAAGEAGLAERSRRPHVSPAQTHPAVATAVCAVRQRHATWGGRKIQAYLRRHHLPGVPAPSTITAILRRDGLLDAREAAERPTTGTFRRFAREQPNELWQLDFMGHRPLGPGQGRVHPMTLIDDHSRYLLALHATTHEDLDTVQPRLTAAFRTYGLPQAILADHGTPWGRGGAPTWTTCEVWLLRLGIEVWHGRPRHPQTQGKVERMHGTISTDVFGTRVLADLAQAQTAFDAFRTVYNHDRPHEMLGYGVPAERYRMSERPFPETLPEIVYADDAAVRIVGYNGTISFAGHRIQIGEAFRQLPVGVVATATDGRYRVQFAHQHVGHIDLRTLDRDATRCPLCP